MSETSKPQIEIETASERCRSQSLWLLFDGESDRQRTARIAATLLAGRDRVQAFRDLLVVQRGGQVVAATWGQLMPGRTALVWPPRMVPGEPEAAANALLKELDRRLGKHGVRLAQAVLPDRHGSVAERLRRGGYHHAADLLYLVSQQDQFPEAPPKTLLSFELFQENRHLQLSRLIEETYVGTLDVPSLNGVRNAEDVLEGYRQTGAFDPARWFLITADGAEVGCLLLADHPGLDQWELVYMGITPAARGRGWGHAIARYAQWQTRRAGRSKLVLAVDSDNEPAITAYGRAGFQEFDCRSVFLKIFTESRSSAAVSQ